MASRSRSEAEIRKCHAARRGARCRGPSSASLHHTEAPSGQHPSEPHENAKGHANHSDQAVKKGPFETFESRNVEEIVLLRAELPTAANTLGRAEREREGLGSSLRDNCQNCQNYSC
jgi:hypothetical protein